jgi:hypothetical protein
MSQEFPWPQPGDVLFSEDGGWWNACVGWTPFQWYGYSEGYRRAAEVLVKHVTETDRDLSTLVFPIVFLYRQALEVSLKHLLVKGCQLLDREKPKITGNRHSLVEHWKHCRPILEAVWPEGPNGDLDAVGDVLTQFERRDPSSTRFRFPDGEPMTRGHIDVPNFAAVAERAYALLDASLTGIGEYLQNKWEIEAEYRAEMEWEGRE